MLFAGPGLVKILDVVEPGDFLQVVVVVEGDDWTETDAQILHMRS